MMKRLWQTCFNLLGLAFMCVIMLGIFQSAIPIEVMRKVSTNTYVVFPIIDTAKGEPVSGASGLDSEFEEWDDASGPSGGFADMGAEAVEIGATGIYSLLVDADEISQGYTVIQIKSSTAGAMTQVILIKTFVSDPTNMATTSDGTAMNISGGIVEANVEEFNNTAITEHTAGYPVVTVKDGTGTGEINTIVGTVGINWANINAPTTIVGLSQTVIKSSVDTETDIAALNNIAAADVWTATGGDSVLQALDYTNNTHEVLRQVVSTLATVTVATDAEADIAALNNISTVEVNTEVDAAIETYKLHKLVHSADADDPVNGSIMAEIAAANGDWSDFVGSTDALEAIRVRGDAEWATATTVAVSPKTGFSLSAAAYDLIGDNVLERTRGVWDATAGFTGGTVVALNQSTDDYWNDNMIVFIEGTAAGQVARITDFTASTDSLTWAPALTVAPAAGDSFAIIGIFGGFGDTNQLAIALSTTVVEILDTLQTYDNSGRFQREVAEILDTLQLYDNAGRFNANAQEILDTLKLYDNAGRFNANAQEILDTLKTYDDAGRFQKLIAVIPDSAEMSRIVGRKVWGIPAGSGSDSTAIADRNVDTAYNSPGATASISAADITEIAETVWATDTNNVLWNGDLGTFGNWNAQAQAATSSTDCECGGGAQTDSILVLDTSGTPAAVANVKVTIKSQSTGAIVAWAVTNGAGYVIVYLDVSTAYTAAGQATSGYFFPPYNFTTGSGATYLDTLKGFNIEAVSTSLAQQTTLTGTAKWGSTILGGAKVHVTLAGSKEFYTTTDLVPSATITTIADPTTGVWSLNVYGTDSLSAPGSAIASYHIRIEHDILRKSGIVLEYQDLLIPADSSAVTQLRTIISGKN